MAARFGATIVPFGAVGEDDLAEVGFLFLFSKSLFSLSATDFYFFNHNSLGFWLL